MASFKKVLTKKASIKVILTFIDAFETKLTY